MGSDVILLMVRLTVYSVGFFDKFWSKYSRPAICTQLKYGFAQNVVTYVRYTQDVMGMFYFKTKPTDHESTNQRS